MIQFKSLIASISYVAPKSPLALLPQTYPRGEQLLNPILYNYMEQCNNCSNSMLSAFETTLVGLKFEVGKKLS